MYVFIYQNISSELWQYKMLKAVQSYYPLARTVPPKLSIETVLVMQKNKTHSII